MEGRLDCQDDDGDDGDRSMSQDNSCVRLMFVSDILCCFIFLAKLLE